MKHVEEVRVRSGIRLALKKDERGPILVGVRKGPQKTPIKWHGEVSLKLMERLGGKVVEERRGNNIFLDYGREWLSELVSLDVAYTPFRSDRIRLMGFGVGGTSQLVDADTIRGTAHGFWQGYPNDWGGVGGTGNPTQTDTDPTVTGLEWPVLTTAGDYFDDISVPATFPAAGQVRFTSVLGYTAVSYGVFTSVPLSEIGLFTETVVPNRAVAPRPAPPERYMVAYNTFDTLSKTSSFILQVDWELRFA